LTEPTAVFSRLYDIERALAAAKLSHLHRQARLISQRMIRNKHDERAFLLDSHQFLTRLLNAPRTVETLASRAKTRDHLNSRDPNRPRDPMGLVLAPYHRSSPEKSFLDPSSDQTIVKGSGQPQRVPLSEIGLNALGLLIFIAGTVLFSPVILFDHVNEWLKRKGI
jgi:hypothetical protein